MGTLNEFKEIVCGSNYLDKYIRAKATATCIRCGESAREFYDASARLEYRISALCQRCQDDFFHGTVDDDP